MNAAKLKKDIQVVQIKGLYYVLDDHQKMIRHKPWLGDVFAFMYDRIMEKSVFPKKFNGSIQKHYELLKNEYQHIHGRNVLEIATGSGNAVHFLPSDNTYTGTDISAGLLKKAVKSFNAHQFQDAEFYVAEAGDLPFADACFDMALCHLSINFFKDMEAFLGEVRRVLKPGGILSGSVPVPERKPPKVTIHGRLYTENELNALFQKYHFGFRRKPYENGALLYFEAVLRQE